MASLAWLRTSTAATVKAWPLAQPSPAKQPTVVAADKGPAGSTVHWLRLICSAQNSDNRVSSGRILGAVA